MKMFLIEIVDSGAKAKYLTDNVRKYCLDSPKVLSIISVKHLGGENFPTDLNVRTLDEVEASIDPS